MSEVLTVVMSAASFVVSAVSLLVTVAAYQKLDEEAHETFAVIGADEGNHEARLERLEQKAGLKVIPSPSALDELLDTPTGEDVLRESFADEHENTELQGSPEPATLADDFAPTVSGSPMTTGVA